MKWAPRTKRAVVVRRGQKVDCYTVLVARAGIKRMGLNGFDAYVWFGTWMQRLSQGNSAWSVEVRDGLPWVLSGTQSLLWSCEFPNRGAADNFAQDLVVRINASPSPADWA
jgi:hypothetical protein